MKISFHQTCITPDEPSYLCGHAIRNEISEGVLDDIYCSVLVIEELEKLCFVSVDLVGIDEDLLQSMKEVAMKKGFKEDHIIISVIHTHSAPEFSPLNLFSRNPNTGARPTYRHFLVEQFQNALEGCQNFIEVTMSFGTQFIEGYYGNRNHIEYPADKSVNYIKFTNLQQGDVYLICNITCHPTVLGPQNLFISADLFGALRNSLCLEYHVPVMMLNGAQGDVSNRQYRQGNDSKELKRMCEGVFHQMHGVEFMPIHGESVRMRDISYTIICNTSQEDLVKRLVEANEQLKLATDEDTIKVTKSGIAFIESKLNDELPKQIELRTRLIQLGEVIIVTIGGELFSKFALDIKNAFPSKKIIIWGITDASSGYLVNQEEYGKNYESMATMIPKGSIETYVKHIISELNQF